MSMKCVLGSSNGRVNVSICSSSARNAELQRQHDTYMTHMTHSCQAKMCGTSPTEGQQRANKERIVQALSVSRSACRLFSATGNDSALINAVGDGG